MQVFIIGSPMENICDGKTRSPNTLSATKGSEGKGDARREILL